MVSFVITVRKTRSGWQPLLVLRMGEHITEYKGRVRDTRPEALEAALTLARAKT